jgi:hypothetical protein
MRMPGWTFSSAAGNAMRVVILHVPDCPNTAVLESRLAPILASRP